MTTSDLAAQAKELFGRVSLIEIARAAQAWSRTSGERIPLEWSQDQIDCVLLVLIDQVHCR